MSNVDFQAVNTRQNDGILELFGYRRGKICEFGDKLGPMRRPSGVFCDIGSPKAREPELVDDHLLIVAQHGNSHTTLSQDARGMNIWQTFPMSISQGNNRVQTNHKKLLAADFGGSAIECLLRNHT